VNGRLLTTPEVAEYFHVSPETVLRWYRADQLPAIRLSEHGHLRFREADVDLFEEAHHSQRVELVETLLDRLVRRLEEIEGTSPEADDALQAALFLREEIGERD
jgi:excisionase family DNA binding protein